ncbi:Galactosyltransferase [Lotmaria passim]
MPAAVAPAEFICHASTALWQEALAHRNALWVDMVTDRRPTTKKKLGQRGNWGLPVEVGMSQKLILWLEYAYHAFPDVPYIMKGDDDTYLKVPQFLRDIRYIRGGYSGRNMKAPLGQRDPVGINETEECIYWGGYIRIRSWNRLRYHMGRGYMLHRRLVQVMLEDTDKLNAETVRLAVTPYDKHNAKLYVSLVMNHEDVFVARVLRDKRSRIREVCPFHYATYVEEGKSRHMDLHKWRSVTWDTVLMHRTTPADEYALHYYFQHEHEVSVNAAVDKDAAEQRALVELEQWMSIHVAHNLTGYSRVPEMRWTLSKREDVAYMCEGGNVTVYNVPYYSVRFDALDRTRRSRTSS